MPQLVIIAIATGLFTGFVILLFRAAVDVTLRILLGDSEAFEVLAYAERLALPIAGALFIGIALNWMAPSATRVGVVHVMERLSRHQGFLPLRNALVQFFGGIVALISGQSGGREGPAIHLGAASASILGQAFELPNNSMRTLVACGTAAAIASSFNTPVAGVIFAMEVVMMEYTIGSFIPIIVAAVTSTFLTHYFLGNEAAFTVAPIEIRSLLEIPFIMLSGVVIGCIATAFIMLTQQFAKLSEWPFWGRALLAGTVTGLAAIIAPEVMGVGYDTVSAAMLGELTIGTLIGVVVLKSLTNAAAVGLGLPVGLIGPTLVVGACVGGIMGFIGSQFQPEEAASVALYVMLGMSAMMAAVLQAPLAALMAVLELTMNPNVILPAMLIIVVATLVTGEVFKQKSVYLSMLATLGLQYPPNAVTLHLQRAGVTAIMNRNVARLAATVKRQFAESALANNPRWILVERGPGDLRYVLNAADLRVFLDELLLDESGAEEAEVHLLELPGMRKDVARIDARATVEEAQRMLNSESIEALCVQRMNAPAILGVITQEDIDNYREVS